MSELGAEQILTDSESLYTAFYEEDLRSVDQLLTLANEKLDFRDGLPREETVWEEGDNLTLLQRHATQQVAEKWGMLASSIPQKPFERVVVLGGHYERLKPRIQYAVYLQDIYGNAGTDLFVLSCYRPLHPKEGIDLTSLDTEADLAVHLLERNTNQQFIVDSASGWDDDPSAHEKSRGEYAVALAGRVGTLNATVISGSVPINSQRATTISTLKSLKTYLEGDVDQSLFVTTSLHLPYQSIQIAEVLDGCGEYEVVGMNTSTMVDLSDTSSDAYFRIILQEIGATIKNAFDTKEA